MNWLPTIPGTVANWPLNGSLIDVSGNGINLTVNEGPEIYRPLDACTNGFSFQDDTFTSSGLIVDSPLLRFAGDFTIQFVMKMTANFNQEIFICQPNASPFDTNSIYGFNTDTAAQLDYSDQFNRIGASSSYIGFPGSSTILNSALQAGRAFAFRRRGIGSGHFLIEVFIDGVLQGPTLQTGTNVPLGTEKFVIGQWLGADTPLRAIMANVRVMNIARSDSGIVSDAIQVLAPCGGGGQSGPNAGGGNVSAPTSLVYDAVAAAQFGIALRQGPRS